MKFKPLYDVHNNRYVQSFLHSEPPSRMSSHPMTGFEPLMAQFDEPTSKMSRHQVIDFIGNSELEGRSPSESSWWGAGSGKATTSTP
jgi:hypothetical protein